MFEIKDEIEEVNRKMLDKLLEENEFVTVYFCKFPSLLASLPFQNSFHIPSLPFVFNFYSITALFKKTMHNLDNSTVYYKSFALINVITNNETIRKSD